MGQDEDAAQGLGNGGEDGDVKLAQGNVGLDGDGAQGLGNGELGEDDALQWEDEDEGEQHCDFYQLLFQGVEAGGYHEVDGVLCGPHDEYRGP